MTVAVEVRRDRPHAADALGARAGRCGVSDEGTGPMHVRPLNDLIEHEWADCVCVPSPELVPTDHGDEWMYIHHSLDGREARS